MCIRDRNYPPRIKSLAALQNKILRNDSTTIYCTAVDRDEDDLQYQWSSDAGNFFGSGVNIIWEAPNETGVFIIEVEVNDGKGESTTAQVEIDVVEKFNTPPAINMLKAEPRKVDLGGTAEIECVASDAEGDEITYEWFASEGFIGGIGSKIYWTAPNAEGNYYIVCKVSDPDGESSSDSIAIAVRDFSITQTGDLILFLPFNGNAQDVSGNNNAVTVNGAVLTSDRFGNLQSAYKFDGVDDNMRVTNSTMLNFSNSITVNFWIYIDQLYDREQYPISHGNWVQRWKVSISNNKIRWTINTTGGITDLDSETIITKGQWYNVTGYYSGQDMELYINGKLDAFKYFNGGINSSSVDLTLGQTVPNNTQYNFNGKIDDVRLFDYALRYEEIVQFYDIETSVKDRDDDLPLSFQLLQNYPNPFNSQTNITFKVKNNSLVKIDIYNILGQKVISLLNKEMAAGEHSIIWDGKTNTGEKSNSGVYFIRMIAADYTSVIKAALLN